MMQQTLFDRPTTQPTQQTAARPADQPPHGGGPTSAAAAETIKPHSGRLRTLVYELVENRGGCTDQEIASALGLLSDTARARRCELRDEGYLADGGERRPTSRGRAAVVWTTTSKLFPRKPEEPQA
jgi:hypothetical protein